MAETRAAWFVLKALEKMDRIDRGACIEGMLRSCRGKGVFQVNHPFQSRVTIQGTDEDAFPAMESPVLLDALHRIGDLRKWKFHPLRQTVTQGNRTSLGPGTGNALLSWAYQERLRDRIDENDRTNRRLPL